MSAFRHQSILQRGMTLLELLATLAVSSLLLAGLSYLTQQWMSSVRMTTKPQTQPNIQPAWSPEVGERFK